ncbi:MBOAT family O-acyltransferase, partial [Roseomonas sp. DSM 102946]|nr:MBOAT family O-acyltransferase [Roseomonas sp. DSM 102946]
FYTFVQIAYLVDCGRGRSEAYGLLDYALFVTFFPHLIAGPIVHHHELIPQFRAPRTFRFRSEDAAAGLALFVTGLVKKMLLADPVSALATPVFAGAAQPGMAEAWMAVLAFSLGLYFDFSAYSDMAIGLARIFGIRFPHNFNSPYKALSISDFWRRWHMTLSRFLRDYVYIPLGGNRQGPARRHLNLVLTMLLGGLWHGAGWTFLVWGALHGGYLVVNHLWNGTGRRLSPLAARALTLLAVMFAWVFFAAPGLAEAGSVLSGMAGARGLVQPETLAALEMLRHGGIAALRDHLGGLGALISLSWGLAVLALGSVLVLAAPNSQEIVDGTPDGR